MSISFEVCRNLKPWPNVFQEGDYRQNVVNEALKDIRRGKLPEPLHPDDDDGEFPFDEIFQFAAAFTTSWIDLSRLYTIDGAIAQEVSSVIRLVYYQRPARGEGAFYLPGVGFRATTRKDRTAITSVDGGVAEVHAFRAVGSVVASPLWAGSVELTDQRLTAENLQDQLGRIGVPANREDLDWFLKQGLGEKFKLEAAAQLAREAVA